MVFFDSVWIKLCVFVFKFGKCMGDLVYVKLWFGFWVIFMLLGIIDFWRLNGGMEELWFVKYL